jgi:hypothetical protein
VVAVVAPVAASAGSATTPTCLGVRATVVGSPRQSVVGTRHRDVIVTAGASTVDAATGNDLICVTGSSDFVLVESGVGDDSVFVTSTTSRVQVITASGNDSYVGNGQADLVVATLDGTDRISTGGGRDRVLLRTSVRAHRTHLDLGPGHDQLVIKTSADHGRPNADRLDANLGRDRVTVSADGSGTAHTLRPRGVEDVEVDNFGRVVLRGDRGPNGLESSNACQVRIYGEGGDDVLRAGTTDAPEACTPAASSTADGGAGSDSCFADVQVSCELSPPARVGKLS